MRKENIERWCCDVVEETPHRDTDVGQSIAFSRDSDISDGIGWTGLTFGSGLHAANGDNPVTFVTLSLPLAPTAG